MCSVSKTGRTELRSRPSPSFRTAFRRLPITIRPSTVRNGRFPRKPLSWGQAPGSNIRKTPCSPSDYVPDCPNDFNSSGWGTAACVQIWNNRPGEKVSPHVCIWTAGNRTPEAACRHSLRSTCRSRFEGFSLANLESMAASVPSVVSDVEENVESVIDRETGPVRSPDDSPVREEAVTGLADDEEARNRYSERQPRTIPAT